MEAVYHRCLRRELERRCVPCVSEVALPIRYKGEQLDYGYRVDLVVRECLLVEIKSVQELLPIHEAQMLTYLRLSTISAGLLINFNVTQLHRGVRRLLI